MSTVLRSCCVALLSLVVISSTARAAEYFVGLDGADANPGDSDHAFRTIGRGILQLQPGDTLVVTPGTYAESVVIARAGLTDAPITLRGLPGAVLVNPQPGSSLSAIDLYGAAAYIAVQGFEIAGGFAESVFVRPGAHDIELAELDVHHNHAGIWIAGASQVVIRDTWVHHNARSGVRLFAGAHDVHIVDLRAEYQDDGRACLGDADGLSADETTRDIQIVRVQSVGNSEDGFDLGTANVELREVEARANACSGMKLGAGGQLQNVLITGSRIGLNISGDAETSTAISNCTLLDNGIGVRALSGEYHVAIQNCIVSGVGKALYVNGAVVLSEHHNIFHRPDSDSRLIVRTTAAGELLYSGADVNSGLWQVASGGQGEGTIAVDPGLDGTGRALGARSPAIDSGSAAGSPAVDLAGVARPQGRAVDRGAFEHVSPLPEAVISRVVIRGDGDGRGEVRLGMHVTIPDELLLDLTAQPVQLTLRGTGGVVATVVIDGEGRTRAGATGHRRRVRYRRAGSERITVTLRPTANVVRVSFRAAGANIAAVQDNELWADIEVGRVFVTARARLRGVAGRMSLP